MRGVSNLAKCTKSKCVIKVEFRLFVSKKKKNVGRGGASGEKKVSCFESCLARVISRPITLQKASAKSGPVESSTMSHLRTRLVRRDSQ